jgi:hypothetical protein
MANTHNLSSTLTDLDISKIDDSTPTDLDNSEIGDEISSELWTDWNPGDSNDIHVVVQVDEDGKVIIDSFTMSVNKD